MEPWITSASSPTPASKMPKPRFEHLNNSFKHKVTPHPTTSFRLPKRKNKISHTSQTYQHHQPTTNHARHQPHLTNEQHQQPRSHNQLPRNQEHYRTWASKHALLITLLLQHTPPLLAVQVTLLHKPQSPTYRTASTIYQAQTPHVLSPQPHHIQSQQKQWTLGLKNSQFQNNTRQPFRRHWAHCINSWRKFQKQSKARLQTKQHRLVYQWHWRQRRAMRSSTSCCCLRSLKSSD